MIVVINGGGTTTEHLVVRMLEQRHRVTIMEEDLETVEHLAEVMPRQVTIVQGDGCDSEVQRDAGMAEADLFIAMTGHDETNLVACELAMANFHVPRCIANIGSPKNEKIFRLLGIEPVSSTELIARMVEEEAVIGDMRMVFSLREGDIIMAEGKLPQRMRNREGIRASKITLPKEVRLIAVIRDEAVEMISADTYLMPGETVVAAMKSDAEAAFKATIKRL